MSGIADLHVGGLDSGSAWVFMLGIWEGAGIVDLHVGHLGGSGSSCWALGRGAGIVDLHVGHLGGRLG